MIFYPMVISAVVVLVTLVYASYLDIKDRRVPFKTWYPMVVVGIAATIVLFYQQTENISLICGYLALIASFFYADYLDNRDPGTPFRFYYLVAVLALPAISWFIVPAISTGKLPEIQLIPWYVMFVGLLAYVSYRESKKRPERKLTAKQTPERHHDGFKCGSRLNPLVFRPGYHHPCHRIILHDRRRELGRFRHLYRPCCSLLRCFLYLRADALLWRCRCLGTHLHCFLHPDISHNPAPKYATARVPFILGPDQRADSQPGSTCRNFYYQYRKRKPGPAHVHVLRVPGRGREDPGVMGLCDGGLHRNKGHRGAEIYRVLGFPAQDEVR